MLYQQQCSSCRKKLRSFPETIEGLEMLRDHVSLMTDNAAKFAEVLVDADLQNSAAQLRGRFTELYDRKLLELQHHWYF